MQINRKSRESRSGFEIGAVTTQIEARAPRDEGRGGGIDVQRRPTTPDDAPIQNGCKTTAIDFMTATTPAITYAFITSGIKSNPMQSADPTRREGGREEGKKEGDGGGK